MVWHDCKTDPPKTYGTYIVVFNVIYQVLGCKDGTNPSTIFGGIILEKILNPINGQKLICLRLSE